MATPGFDTDALIEQFSQATAKQGEAVRKAVQEATLKALQGRELTLKSIKNVLKTVTQAASTGAAQNAMPGVDVEDLLSRAVAGMDAAVLQAVEANRRALQQLVDQGVDLREKQFKKALGEIEKMEDAMFAAINKAVGDTTAQTLQGPWGQALAAFRQGGTATGSGAEAAVEQLTARAQEAARQGRALGVRASQAMLDHYAALASGVLIGMSEAMSAGSQASAAAPGGTKRARKG